MRTAHEANQGPLSGALWVQGLPLEYLLPRELVHVIVDTHDHVHVLFRHIITLVLPLQGIVKLLGRWIDPRRIALTMFPL